MSKLFAFLLISVFAFSAQALNLKDKKRLSDAKDELAKKASAKMVKDKCGQDIPVTIEDSVATSFAESTASIAAHCDAARSTVAYMCDEAAYKPSIVKIKKIKCAGGEKEKFDLKIAGDTLEFKVGPGASNLDKGIKAWLENNLQ